MAEQVSNPTASVNMDPPESDTKQIEDRIPDSSSEIPKGTTKPANEPAAKDEKEKIDEKNRFQKILSSCCFKVFAVVTIILAAIGLGMVLGVLISFSITQLAIFVQWISMI